MDHPCVVRIIHSHQRYAKLARFPFEGFSLDLLKGRVTLAEREQKPPPHFLATRSLACRFVIITVRPLQHESERRAFHYASCNARQKRLIAEIRNDSKKKQSRETSHEIPRHFSRATTLDGYLSFLRKHKYFNTMCTAKQVNFNLNDKCFFLINS